MGKIQKDILFFLGVLKELQAIVTLVFLKENTALFMRQHKLSEN